MRIVSHRKLVEFYQSEGHGDAQTALERWYDVVEHTSKITKAQYDFALQRIEELLPLVDDNTPTNDRNAVELTLMSDTVIEYEKEHFPIGKPTVAQLIELSLEGKNMSQKQLAQEIGVSPSRISDYISGRAEPTLKIARLLCQVLNITPAAMMGC